MSRGVVIIDFLPITQPGIQSPYPLKDLDISVIEADLERQIESTQDDREKERLTATLIAFHVWHNMGYVKLTSTFSSRQAADQQRVSEDELFNSLNVEVGSRTNLSYAFTSGLHEIFHERNEKFHALEVSRVSGVAGEAERVELEKQRLSRNTLERAAASLMKDFPQIISTQFLALRLLQLLGQASGYETPVRESAKCIGLMYAISPSVGYITSLLFNDPLSGCVAISVIDAHIELVCVDGQLVVRMNNIKLRKVGENVHGGFKSLYNFIANFEVNIAVANGDLVPSMRAINITVDSDDLPAAASGRLLELCNDSANLGITVRTVVRLDFCANILRDRAKDYLENKKSPSWRDIRQRDPSERGISPERRERAHYLLMLATLCKEQFERGELSEQDVQAYLAFFYDVQLQHAVWHSEKLNRTNRFGDILEAALPAKHREHFTSSVAQSYRFTARVTLEILAKLKTQPNKYSAGYVNAMVRHFPSWRQLMREIIEKMHDCNSLADLSSTYDKFNALFSLIDHSNTLKNIFPDVDFAQSKKTIQDFKALCEQMLKEPLMATEQNLHGRALEIITLQQELKNSSMLTAKDRGFVDQAVTTLFANLKASLENGMRACAPVAMLMLRKELTNYLAEAKRTGRGVSNLRRKRVDQFLALAETVATLAQADQLTENDATVFMFMLQTARQEQRRYHKSWRESGLHRSNRFGAALEAAALALTPKIAQNISGQLVFCGALNLSLSQPASICLKMRLRDVGIIHYDDTASDAFDTLFGSRLPKEDGREVMQSYLRNLWNCTDLISLENQYKQVSKFLDDCKKIGCEEYFLDGEGSNLESYVSAVKHLFALRCELIKVSLLKEIDIEAVVQSRQVSEQLVTTLQENSVLEKEDKEMISKAVQDYFVGKSVAQQAIHIFVKSLKNVDATQESVKQAYETFLRLLGVPNNLIRNRYVLNRHVFYELCNKCKEAKIDSAVLELLNQELASYDIVATVFPARKESAASDVVVQSDQAVPPSLRQKVAFAKDESDKVVKSTDYQPSELGEHQSFSEIHTALYREIEQMYKYAELPYDPSLPHSDSPQLKAFIVAFLGKSENRERVETFFCNALEGQSHKKNKVDDLLIFFFGKTGAKYFKKYNQSLFTTKLQLVEHRRKEKYFLTALTDGRITVEGIKECCSGSADRDSSRPTTATEELLLYCQGEKEDALNFVTTKKLPLTASLKELMEAEKAVQTRAQIDEYFLNALNKGEITEAAIRACHADQNRTNFSTTTTHLRVVEDLVSYCVRLEDALKFCRTSQLPNFEVKPSSVFVRAWERGALPQAAIEAWCAGQERYGSWPNEKPVPEEVKYLVFSCKNERAALTFTTACLTASRTASTQETTELSTQLDDLFAKVKFDVKRFINQKSSAADDTTFKAHSSKFPFGILKKSNTQPVAVAVTPMAPPPTASGTAVTVTPTAPLPTASAPTSQNNGILAIFYALLERKAFFTTSNLPINFSRCIQGHQSVINLVDLRPDKMPSIASTYERGNITPIVILKQIAENFQQQFIEAQQPQQKDELLAVYKAIFNNVLNSTWAKENPAQKEEIQQLVTKTITTLQEQAVSAGEVDKIQRSTTPDAAQKVGSESLTETEASSSDDETDLPRSKTPEQEERRSSESPKVSSTSASNMIAAGVFAPPKDLSSNSISTSPRAASASFTQ